MTLPFEEAQIRLKFLERVRSKAGFYDVHTALEMCRNPRTQEEQNAHDYIGEYWDDKKAAEQYRAKRMNDYASFDWEGTVNGKKYQGPAVAWTSVETKTGRAYRQDLVGYILNDEDKLQSTIMLYKTRIESLMSSLSRFEGYEEAITHLEKAKEAL